MDYKKNEIIGSRLLIFLIAINCISLFDFKLFSLYDSFAIYGNFLALLFILIINKIYKEDLNRYIFILMFLAYGFFTLIISDGGFGSVITPVFSFLLVYILYDGNFNDKKLKILFIIFLLLNIFWVINSSGYYIKALYNKDQFLNSNTIGMILFYTAVYVNILSKKLKLKFSKVLSIIILIVSFWAIINVESRGALLTLIMFIILNYFLPWKLWSNRRISLVLFSLVILIGTLFPVIYTQMYMSGVNYSIPFTTKSLYTGREVIWLNYFESANKPSEWLFGLGSNAKLWAEENLNVHNNYLAVITNFGVIGYLMYYGFILNQINKIYRRGKITKYQCSLLIGFMCVLIYGFVEISTLWHIMFFFNFLFLGLAYNETKQKGNIVT